ncbi:MAG TPA: DUF1566 domain-containing protein, partial [Polyangia bacterium]|nr:DUF1566 domain-containing protein [Polyangia bacterium]
MRALKVLVPVVFLLCGCNIFKDLDLPADDDTGTDVDADTDTDTDADTDSDADSDTDADTDVDADTDNDTDTDADSDTDTDTDADADADTDTDGDADTDSCIVDTACGAGCVDCTQESEICHENWGICVVPSCVGEDDFTPCEVVTADPTDRSYDICVEETCVSPGCGDGTCNTPGPHFPLADTGQRLCYDNDSPEDCTIFPCDTDGGPEFCGQDWQYGWDTTHGPSERFARDLSVSGQPIVTDNVTGLIWQGCSYGLTGDDCTGGSATAAGWSAQLVNCDGLDWGGHADWRLPDRYELMSILDHGKASAPLIDATAFPNTPSSYSYFWSSSSRANNTSYAWAASFEYGGLLNSGKTVVDFYARCVRGGPTPRPPRFARDTSTADQPTVLDNWTGLEWQGCVFGQTGDDCGTGSATTSTWQATLDYCEELDWGGDSDWRLPNMDELRGIVDNHLENPSIDPTAYPATPSRLLWSSSSRAANASDAWFVDFSFG